MRHGIRRLLAGLLILSVLSASLLEATAAHGHAEFPGGEHAADAPDAGPESLDADGCDASCHASGHLVGLVREGLAAAGASRSCQRDSRQTDYAGRDSPPPTPPPNI